MLTTLVLAALIAQPPAGEAPKAQPPATPPATTPAEPKKDDAVKTVTAQPAEPTPAIKPVTLPSGVVIEDLVEGNGDESKPGTSVVVNYKGMLKDGKVFDSTEGRGTAMFPLFGVIKGWQEGIPGMKVGGKRRLTIPAKLAYGSREIKNPKTEEVIIPAFSDLVFEVELVATMLIEDIKVGEGEEVKPNATVTAHYLGTRRKDGFEFDSSYKHGTEPSTFGLNQVIKGWTWGLPGMKVGGKRKLTIPWQLAYGEAGRGKDIPPKADLVFEITLTAVQNPPQVVLPTN